MKTSNLNILLISVILILPFFNVAAYHPDDAERTGIYGKVYAGNEGAPFVTVYLKGTSKGTSTDADGNFVLVNLEAGPYILRVQGMGYKGIERHIVLDEGSIIEMDFYLEQDIHLMEQVVVSGSRIGVLRYLPGSASVITNSDLRSASPLSGNEILRNVTGLNVVEEEGGGLRANIGVRGLDPDRSRNVLILEDGIPVALGPYGEPELYYTPAIDRMSGVEILKGSGSILYGPQTIGGVINYITADPPAAGSGYANISGGEGGLFTGNFGYGNTYGNSGFQINFLRRQAENLGPTRFLLNDLSTKFRFKISPRAAMMVKLGIYDENSNSTYIGLTQLMYDAGGNDYSRLAPDDRLDIRRYSLSLSHTFNAGDDLRLTTTAYAYTTARNWKRQDFSTDANASNLTGVVWGDESIHGGAIFMRNSTGNRNRQFEVAGIEPRISYRYNMAGYENMVDAGARFLYERAYEQRVNGSTADAISGALRDDEIRTGHAASSWVQNKILLGSRLSLTGGVRTEMLEYERYILRSGSADVNILNNTRVVEVIPGAGMNYNFNDRSGIFTGIHRGFAPPRIKDAITSDGQDMKLDAEKSWNFEFGTRAELFRSIGIELTFFNMEFSNQVIPVSESSGGRGTGYINGGRTSHRGLESELRMNFSEIINMPGNLSFNLNSTFTESVFSGDRFVIERIANGELNDTIFRNVKGNNTPYAPRISASGFIQYEAERGFGLRIGGHYTGRQYTDVLNTESVTDWFGSAQDDPQYNYVQATASGQIGRLPSFFVINASAWYDLPGGLNLNVCVKNLMDERYITSRRPQGIRVGLPRLFTAGLSYSF
jgi:Fe(3+) dicitrate transport protein